MLNQKKGRKIVTSIISLFIFCSFSLAYAERPKIGLALAGGGAKGSAHIAVLEVLQDNHIPIDFIAGTSIGAYIGGLYALGFDAEQIKTIVYNANLEKGYSDNIARENLPYRNKQQDDIFNVPLQLGYRDGRIRIPSGLLQGQSMSQIYRRSVGSIADFDSFDDLAIPFRAIATDLTTSKAVILDRGNLLQAMQASASVPGALVPVQINGQVLVDGGLSDNLPIQVVRDMGADIVIAVDISSPLMSMEQLNNTISVLRQLSGFLTVQSINQQKDYMLPGDIYIRPEIEHLSSTDFSIMPQAFDAGLAAAHKENVGLQALSVENAVYQHHLQKKQAAFELLQAINDQPIVKIELYNNSHISDSYLLDTLAIDAGRSVNVKELNAAITRIYALDYFERVDARFEEREEGRVLLVNARQKSWGPNYFSMGIGWEDDFSLDSNFNLDFSYTVGNLSDRGGEWRNELGLGTDKLISSEFYLPLDYAQIFYSTNVYEFQSYDWDLFLNNAKVFDVEQHSNRVDFGFGYKYLIKGILEAGITLESGRMENDFFLPDALEYKSYGIYMQLGYDTLNSISFPTNGSRLTLKLIQRNEDISGDLLTANSASGARFNSTQLLADWKSALDFGHHALVLKASYAYLNSAEDDRSVYFVHLGGFLNLSGYHRDALVGHKKAFTALIYQYEISRALGGIEGFPLYVGTSLEAGNAWLESEAMDLADMRVASSLYIGTNTRMGPVALGLGYAEGNKKSIYFYLGKNF